MERSNKAGNTRACEVFADCRAVRLVDTPVNANDVLECEDCIVHRLAGSVTCIVVLMVTVQERPGCVADTLLSTPYNVVDDCRFAMFIVTHGARSCVMQTSNAVTSR